LFQTALLTGSPGRVAVLEQPSSRRVAEQALGRRNIALVETTELNAIPVCAPEVE
jgi:hypothetical protein